MVESLPYAWGKVHAKPEGSLGSSLAIESIVAVGSLELATSTTPGNVGANIERQQNSGISGFSSLW